MTAPSLDWPPYLILTPLFGALLVVLVGWLSRHLRNWLLVLTLLADLSLALRWRTPTGPSSMVASTIEASGRQVTFTLRNDALSGLLLVLLAASALVIAYAAAGLANRPHGLRSSVSFLLALAAANGALLSGDWLTLYGFAELTSLFLMMLLLSESSALAQRAGFKLFAAVEVAGLTLLLASLLMSAQRASLDLAALQSLAGLGVVVQAMLLAMAARAGLVPLHTWLTEALQTASWPAGALIGTLAAPLGCYLLLRLAASPAASGLPLQGTLLALGVATVLVAAYVMLQRRSVQQAIATLALAQGGFFALGLAAGGALGVEAALAQLVYMVLFVSLPLIALGSLPGSADAAAAPSSAIARRPLAGLLLAASLLSAAGLPPFYGFFAREYVLQALLLAGSIPHLLSALAVLLASGALLAGVAKLIALMFAGEEVAVVAQRSLTRPVLALPLGVAAAVMLAFGAAPLTLHRWLIGPALAAALPLPGGATLAGMTWGTGLAGLLLILALFGGGWVFLTAGRRSPASIATSAFDAHLGSVAADLAYLSKAGYFDPYNLAVVVTSIGRGVALALGWVLGKLAI